MHWPQPIVSDRRWQARRGLQPEARGGHEFTRGYSAGNHSRAPLCDPTAAPSRPVIAARREDPRHPAAILL